MVRGWTLNQYNAFLCERKSTAGQLGSANALFSYQRARWDWKQQRDRWGNDPLTIDDYLANRHKA